MSVLLLLIVGKKMASCAGENIIVNSISPFRAKLIQTHDEPKVNPGKCCLGSSCDSMENQVLRA